MSLIQDALKASQREKDRRSSGGSAPPLIVPLRSKPRDEFNWKNAITIGVSLAVIAGSGVVLYYRMFRPTATRQVVSAPAPSLTPDPRADSPSVVQSAPVPAPPQVVARQPDSANVQPATPPRVTRVARAPVRRGDTAVAQQSRTTIPLSRPTADAPRPTPGGEPVTPSGGGRLNIAVEQPRGYEAARLFAMGVAAHRAGDLDAARSAYERVLLLAPNDVDALNNLGVLLAAQGEYDRAEQVLRRTVRLAPRNPGAWNNLGAVMAQRGHPGEAIAAFQEALQVDPLNTAARVSLAQQHLAIGSAGRARELLEEVLVANPSLPEAHYTLGQVFEAQKDWAGAVRAYEAFIRTAPTRLSASVERVRQRVDALRARVK